MNIEILASYIAGELRKSDAVQTAEAQVVPRDDLHSVHVVMKNGQQFLVITEEITAKR